MAIQPNSYGTVAMVAESVPKYTRNGVFASTTTPIDTAVERWINQISSIVNGMMASQGFAIPVTQADVVLALEAMVVDNVVDLAHRANSSGRFYDDNALRTRNPLSVIRKELGQSIEDLAPGFENMGAARDSAFADLGFRGTDDEGNEIENIFKRDDFGNTFDF